LSQIINNLYESKACFLLPRWYGKPGEWEAFAEEAASARGGDDGDILYMAIARSQAWSERENFFKNTSISYERMQRGFEASLKRYPNYTWEMNSYCYFACIANDRSTAKDMFGKINGRWEGAIWGDESYFKKWSNGDYMPVCDRQRLQIQMYQLRLLRVTGS